MVAMQIRDVPESERDEIAAEAKRRGVSVQAYLHEVLEREVKAIRQRRWLDEVTANASRTPIATDDDVIGLIRRDRDRNHAA